MTKHTSPTTRTPRRPFPDDLRPALLRAAYDRRRQLAELPPVLRADAVATAHRESVRRILAAIHAALDRLDDGTYGDCAECGLPIPLARLRACPWATTCTWCAGR